MIWPFSISNFHLNIYVSIAKDLVGLNQNHFKLNRNYRLFLYFSWWSSEKKNRLFYFHLIFDPQICKYTAFKKNNSAAFLVEYNEIPINGIDMVKWFWLKISCQTEFHHFNFDGNAVILMQCSLIFSPHFFPQFPNFVIVFTRARSNQINR